MSTALAFLTRIRLGGEGTHLSAAYGWFPLVGAVVGGVGGLVFWTAGLAGLPASVGALLAVGAMVLLTGGLHEDGLADTADGLGAGPDRERALRIMKDSHIGSYGVLALILVTGLRFASLSAIGDGPAGGWAAALGLILAASLSRGALPFLARWLEPARPGGLGAQAGRPAPTALVLAAGLSGLMLAMVLSVGAYGIGTLVIILVAMLVGGLSLGWLFRRRLGGYTGDTLGAAQQLLESLLLLCLAGIAGMP